MKKAAFLSAPGLLLTFVLFAQSPGPRVHYIYYYSQTADRLSALRTKWIIPRRFNQSF